MRQALDEDTIDEYAEAMEAGAVFPPVVVFFDGDTYWMGDGFHRYHAARRAGHIRLLAEQRDGGCREALLYACSANASHGLRRTNADKHKVVTTMLADEEWGRWSNRQIARHCGVDEKMVRSLRQSRSDDAERRYVTRHGTEAMMDTSNIGRRATNGQASPSSHAGDEAGEEEDERDDRAPVAPPPPDHAQDPLLAWREAYPEFVHPGISAEDFRILSEALDAMPMEQRLEYRARWRRHDMNALAELLGEPGFSEPDPVEVAGHRASERWDKFFYSLSVLACSVQDGWGALMATWPVARKQAALANLRQWHALVGEWIQAIEEDLGHGTHAEGIKTPAMSPLPHWTDLYQTELGVNPYDKQALLEAVGKDRAAAYRGDKAARRRVAAYDRAERAFNRQVADAEREAAEHDEDDAADES